ncbi:MAG: acyl-homoserine-lactone synthase [Pseudomonadota bacterium]
MFQILSFADLQNHEGLQQSMFLDRAVQFVDRLAWDIALTEDGLEIDQYDDRDALYLIALNARGRHAASMRLRPTTAVTMLRDIFPSMDGAKTTDKAIWESTRFCIAPGADMKSAARVLLAGQALGLAQGLQSSLGIYDLRMERVYRRLGWSPEKLSEADDPSGRVALGAWHFSKDRLLRLSSVCGISPKAAMLWVKRAKGLDPIFT